jgi:GxxExxY protein
VSVARNGRPAPRIYTVFYGVKPKVTQIVRINFPEKFSMKHMELTEKIIQAFFTVYNTLGYGFFENVYENAMFIELTEMGLNVEKQKKVQIFYKGYLVGSYFADMIVENVVVCEFKSNEVLYIDDEKQLLNYLKGTSFETGLLLNFGIKAEVKRKMITKVGEDKN